MYHGGRMSALSIVSSNKWTTTPPIRMHQEGLEINVGAIHAHSMLVAECICDCALLPGLRGMQEVFCNNQPGPAGLSAPVKEKEKPTAGSKRTAEDESKIPEGAVSTLPYSYDVVGLALSKDAGQMLYDDMGTKWCETAVAKYGTAYGMSMQFDDLPHLSMRYIGYEEHNRQASRSSSARSARRTRSTWRPATQTKRSRTSTRRLWRGRWAAR